MDKIEYKKGDDIIEEESLNGGPIFGIHLYMGGVMVHGNAIEVYTTEEVRDKIIELLNVNTPKE